MPSKSVEIINKLGLLNSLLALIAPSMVSAFGIFLMRQFVAAIPNDLIDAARLDGASEWTIYWQLIRPQLGPAMATLGIFTFMSSWNDYLWPFLVIKSDTLKTLVVGLVGFEGRFSTDYGPLMAGYAIASIPLLILFLVAMRSFIEGLSQGALKA